MVGKTTDGIGVNTVWFTVRSPLPPVLCFGVFRIGVSGAGAETSLARTSLRLTRAPVFTVNHAGFAEFVLSFWI